MLARFVITLALLAIGCGLDRCRASAPHEEGEQAGTAVLYKDKLIHLDEKGRFRAWSPNDAAFDPELTARLSEKKTITHLASDGERLWAAGRSALFSWSADDRSWKMLILFDGGGEDLIGLVPVGGSPLLVFPSKVIGKGAGGGRTFPVPKLQGPFRRNFLRVLALHATDSMLWIGTGHGEWGGHLLGLDPRTGQWVQYFDALHYVTGITQERPDELIVSWSMSHFGANTLIRVHKLDATPKTSHPRLRSRYYQRIAYSPFDKILYGIENTDLVSIKQGRPTKITGLNLPVFEAERAAIGVAPGLSALLPVAEKTLIIVPSRGDPWRFRDGKPRRLHAP